MARSRLRPPPTHLKPDDPARAKLFETIDTSLKMRVPLPRDAEEEINVPKKNPTAPCQERNFPSKRVFHTLQFMVTIAFWFTAKPFFLNA